MNWSFILIGFCLAVVVGASAVSILARIRPQWSGRRRLFTASVILPAVTILATAATIVAIVATGAGADQGETMQDLVVATIVRFGALFTLLALAGSLVGAWLRQLRMRR